MATNSNQTKPNRPESDFLATAPEDWDEAASGPWQPPLIKNPAYHGPWKQRMVRFSSWHSSIFPGNTSRFEFFSLSINFPNFEFSVVSTHYLPSIWKREKKIRIRRRCPKLLILFYSSTISYIVLLPHMHFLSSQRVCVFFFRLTILHTKVNGSTPWFWTRGITMMTSCTCVVVGARILALNYGRSLPEPFSMTSSSQTPWTRLYCTRRWPLVGRYHEKGKCMKVWSTPNKHSRLRR